MERSISVLKTSHGSTVTNYNPESLRQIDTPTVIKDEPRDDPESENPEEFVEIKEQIYLEKLNSLKEQLQQLNDGTFLEYKQELEQLEAAHKDRVEVAYIWRDYLLEKACQEHKMENRAVAKDFEEKAAELKESLVADVEEQRKILENEQLMMGINNDYIDPKPLLPRKLRRRPNDVTYIPEKKKKSQNLQIRILIDDKDLESDFKDINKANISAGKKPVIYEKLSALSKKPADIRIKDGKIKFDKRWYLRGQPIYIEGKDVPKFPCIISSVGTENFMVNRIDGGGKVKVSLSQLINGKLAIKRRAG